MSGGYCAMSEHDDRFEQLNAAIDSAIERLKDIVEQRAHRSYLTPASIKRELESILASLEEVR